MMKHEIHLCYKLKKMAQVKIMN